MQDNLEQNFKLDVGSASETITVQANAVNVNTTDSTVSTVVDRTFADNIPLNGRSFQTLIMLTPGVVVTQTAFDDQGQFSVNGQRADANYFTVDGVSANFGVTGYSVLVQAAGGALPALSASGGTNSLVSVDAMQEFRVQTSSFAPEFGRTPVDRFQSSHALERMRSTVRYSSISETMFLTRMTGLTATRTTRRCQKRKRDRTISVACSEVQSSRTRPSSSSPMKVCDYANQQRKTLLFQTQDRGSKLHPQCSRS